MISFFTRPSYIGNRYPDHTSKSSVLRISARIRGDEMAQFLGARINPKDDYEDDICIHVKPKWLHNLKDGDYLDYLDGKNMWLLLKDRPKVNVIAASQASYEFLRSNLENKIFLIPQHHLNWENTKRKRKKKVKVGGYIGSPSPVAFKMYDKIRQELKKVGCDFITCFDYKTRQDAVNLYQSIDFFVIGDWTKDDSHTKIPTKIINAASFGVPTIAYPLKGYQEVEGNYIHAHNITEMLAEVEKFRDEDYYSQWSDKVQLLAQDYHISKIADLYRVLK